MIEWHRKEQSLLDTAPGSRETLQPFLKWAGGKRWLVEQYPQLFPNTYQTYFEPFLGSAAVFFYLRPRYAILSDINEQLIATYLAVRRNPLRIISLLSKHHRHHSKKYYYEQRSVRYTDPFESAAQLIYLNRTCWNGLYRVNLSGVFNVPIGTKSKVLTDTDDFFGISNALKRAQIKVSDFVETLASASRDDFVFVDPPYTANHNENGFLKYNERLFSWQDQIRLRDAIENAAARGVKVLLTNGSHTSIVELYKDFEISKVARFSILSADPTYRSRVKELVVSTWK